MKEIHFYDLDGTLVNVNNYVWIVDKERPQIPILKLDPLEFSLVKYNYHKSHNLKIEYDGEYFFLSPEIWNNIQKRKKLSLDRTGLSLREYKDKEFIETCDFDFLYRNIKHLSGRNDINLAFLTARPDRRKHSNFTNKLRHILKNLHLRLYKLYFVGDKTEIHHKEYLAHRKSIVLLEHLLGIKTEGTKFVPFKQDKFDKVYFYDDSDLNVDSAIDIQSIFNEYYSNTDDDFKLYILKRIEDKPELIINHVSTNETKPFKTNKVILAEPLRYPIVQEKKIKRFNQFGRSI
jgi:hypothetical protein